jgi:hypothetical protein
MVSIMLCIAWHGIAVFPFGKKEPKKNAICTQTTPALEIP